MCTCRDRRCPFKIEFARHEEYLAAAARGNVMHPNCGSYPPRARVIHEDGFKIVGDSRYVG